ncbi:hypothetical protein KX729_30410 [Rhizobium sp. XQZ8]|uniref:hypothetical protein n=1 Tax=Rhizobium populisoli TaxID=2859785 RepID=UPI001CA4AEE5|nr:hypothetical protein [Rhizobium populisoli]MBW6425707.1 hypothetical protein [Rhizobium populisoli]
MGEMQERTAQVATGEIRSARLGNRNCRRRNPAWPWQSSPQLHRKGGEVVNDDVGDIAEMSVATPNATLPITSHSSLGCNTTLPTTTVLLSMPTLSKVSGSDLLMLR